MLLRDLPTGTETMSPETLVEADSLLLKTPGSPGKRDSGVEMENWPGPNDCD